MRMMETLQDLDLRVQILFELLVEFMHVDRLDGHRVEGFLIDGDAVSSWSLSAVRVFKDKIYSGTTNKSRRNTSKAAGKDQRSPSD